MRNGYVHTYARNSPSWNPKVHSPVDTSPPFVRNLSQINPFHAPSLPISVSFRYDAILSSYQRLSLPGVLFPSGFATRTLSMFRYQNPVYVSLPEPCLCFATRTLSVFRYQNPVYVSLPEPCLCFATRTLSMFRYQNPMFRYQNPVCVFLLHKRHTPTI